MGTRGLIGLKKDSIYYGYYNHFDSYPEGLGQQVVSFLKGLENNDLVTLSKNVGLMDYYDPDATPSQYLKEKYKKFSNLNVSSRSLDEWYCLLREIQGVDTLTHILSGELRHAEKNAMSFIKDSLFCEYAYIVNLDACTLELYRGFQGVPDEGNIFGTENNGSNYFPCKLAGSFPLDDIPDDWQNIAFPSEDEEEEDHVSIDPKLSKVEPHDPTVDDEVSEFDNLLEELDPYLRHYFYRKALLLKITSKM